METSRLRKRMPVTALTDPKIVLPAIGSAFAKLDPRVMMKNPVMFVVEVVAALTTVIFFREWMQGGEHLGFTFQIIVWLWFTVLFANFAEAVAEGRGKAQAATLRQTREETKAKLIVDEKRGLVVPTPAGELAPGQVVLVEAGDLIPSDGEVIEGVASVNEAAITGESRAGHSRGRRRPFGRHRRHAGRLRLAQGAHHRRPGLDLSRPHDCARRGRRAPEDAQRDRAQHSARRHDHHLRVRHGDHPELRGLRRRNGFDRGGRGAVRDADPDHDRRAAVGHRHCRHGSLVRFNVLAMSGRAVEAAGDVDTLLLDKTGTITLGNRQAAEFKPVSGVTERELADAAQLASLADETPEGRSIVVLAKEKYGIRGRDIKELGAKFIPFTAQSRMSGVEIGDSWIRKGAVDAILDYLTRPGPASVGAPPRKPVGMDLIRQVNAIAEDIAKSGGTPLAVAKDGRLLGVIHLKDIVKGGIRERFAEQGDGHPHRHDHRR